MEIGGIKTRWMFADDLPENKEFVGELTGVSEHQCRDGKTKMPYVVWVGALNDGITAEYQVSVWNIESKEKFEAGKPGQWKISRRNKRIFFEPQ